MPRDCEICFTISILSFMMSTVLFKLYICLLYMHVHQFMYANWSILELWFFSDMYLVFCFCILLHINHTILPARLMLTIENESNAMYSYLVKCNCSYFVVQCPSITYNILNVFLCNLAYIHVYWVCEHNVWSCIMGMLQTRRKPHANWFTHYYTRLY